MYTLTFWYIIVAAGVNIYLSIVLAGYFYERHTHWTDFSRKSTPFTNRRAKFNICIPKDFFNYGSYDFCDRVSSFLYLLRDLCRHDLDLKETLTVVTVSLENLYVDHNLCFADILCSQHLSSKLWHCDFKNTFRWSWHWFLLDCKGVILSFNFFFEEFVLTNIFQVAHDTVTLAFR